MALQNLFNAGISGQGIYPSQTGQVGVQANIAPNIPLNTLQGGSVNPNILSSLNPQTSSGQAPPSTAGKTLGATTNAPPASPAGTTPTSGGAAVDLAGLDAAYQQYTDALNQQRTTTQGMYDLSKENVQNQYNQNIGDINALQTKTAADITSARGTVAQSSQNAVSDARRAYNELQQKNQAYLSAGGISSSSAAEALQEGLSRQTLQALNNITQNKDQTLQHIATQEADVKDFYDRQIANLTTGIAQAKKEIELQMNAALTQIDSNQALAAKDKALAKNNLLSQAASANKALQDQAAQAQSSIAAYTGVQNQVLQNVKGYAGGQVSLQQFQQGMDAIDAQLRSGGMALNREALINSYSNPYLQKQPTNYIVQFTPGRTDQGQRIDVQGNVF